MLFCECGHTRQQSERRIFSSYKGGLGASMQKPNIDGNLTLLADFGKTEAICVDVLDNPATEEGILLKVKARGPFRARPAGLDNRS